jgi:hypothetical protein
VSFPIDALSGYAFKILSNTELSVVLEVDLTGSNLAELLLQIRDRCPGTKVVDHESWFKLTNPAFAATLTIPSQKGGPATVHAYDQRLIAGAGVQPLLPSTKELAESVGGYVHLLTGSMLCGFGAAVAVMIAKQHLDDRRGPSADRGASRQPSRRLL